MIGWAFAILLSSCSAGHAAITAIDGDTHTLEAMVAEFSRCNVARHPDQAQAYVLSTDESNAVGVDEKPFDRKCLYVFRNDLRDTFIASWYRNELAIALIRKDFASRGPMSFSDKSPLSNPPLPDRAKLAVDLAATELAQSKVMVRAIYDRARGEALASRLGECAARRDPEKIRVWVLTGPGDADISTGDERLRTIRDDCARELGTSYAVSRGWVASGYYRLANATPTQTGK